MDLETISMDPRIAAIHYRDYRKKVREHREKRLAEARAEITEGNKKRVAAYKRITQIEKEDTIAMESYRAMAKGARIVNVASCIRDAGLCVDKKLPRIAIARAHWTHCCLRLEGGQLWFAQDTHIRTGWKERGKCLEPTKVVSFQRDLMGAELTNDAWRNQNNFPSITWPNPRAIVPSIPVHLRPAGDLTDYFILWEAVWEKDVPADPFLLRHVAGHMYSVLAQWDLTPLEQSILEGRIS